MRLFRVVLGVSDIGAASDFYGSILGQPGRRVSPGQHYFDVGRSILACVDPILEGQAPIPPMRAPLALAVHDLEAFLGRARAAGAGFDRIAGEMAAAQPTTALATAALPTAALTTAALATASDAPVLDGAILVAASGERSFHCRDPWGNPLLFVEAGTEFTGA